MEYVIVISNFTAKKQEGYRIGVPESGSYVEVFNTDAKEYGGKGITNSEMVAEEYPYHNRSQSITLTIPTLATIYLKQAANRRELLV